MFDDASGQMMNHDNNKGDSIMFEVWDKRYPVLDLFRLSYAQQSILSVNVQP